MNPPSHRRPDFGVAACQRVHFIFRQIEPLVAQLGQRLARPLHEAGAKLFVRQQAAEGVGAVGWHRLDAGADLETTLTQARAVL